MGNEQPKRTLGIDLKVEGNEVTIREGAAAELLPPIKPEKVAIIGDFRAVGRYLNGRTGPKTDNQLQLADPKNAIILTNKEKMTIRLMTNPNSPIAAEVLGKAERSEELSLFGINTGKSYRRDELFKLVRMNRILFSDYQEHSDLLAALKSFKATTSGSSEIDTDMRGNKNIAYQKELRSNMPEYFSLTVPIIKGEAKETFPVEICIEESDGIASFRFESPALQELMAARIDEMFERELAHCLGFVIINV